MTLTGLGIWVSALEHLLEPDHVRQLITHRQRRVQCLGRILEDHRDAVTADLTQFGFGQ